MYRDGNDVGETSLDVASADWPQKSINVGDTSMILTKK